MRSLEVPAALQSALDQSRPLLLDGGLGSLLEARGYALDAPLWTAGLLLSDAEAIIDAHRAYLDAGADCIISASYQASVDGLIEAGVARHDVDRVMRRATDLAREACNRHLLDNPAITTPPLVAASVGPFGASLADGSEYRGNYGVDADRLRRFHAERLQCLDASGADLLAVETIPDRLEAAILAELLAFCNTPAWVSFCCRDEAHLQDGSELVDAVAPFADLPTVIAIGANCVAPEIVTGLVETVKNAAPAKLIVVYPNSGAQYDAERKRWHSAESPLAWSRQAAQWYRAGARLIGGCCRVGPEHIRHLATRTTWHY